MTAKQSLGRKSFVNVAWSYTSFLGSKLFGFVAIVVLARLLGPEDFGLMGFCIIAIAYLQVLSRFGLGAALISRIEDVNRFANAIFFLGIANGFLFWTVAWLSAPSIAAFFEQPEVASLLPVLALALIIEAFSVVPDGFLQRELRFRAKLVPDFGRGVVKGTTAIILAFQGYGVWSLVIGHLAGSLTFTILVFAVRPWRPRRDLDPQVCRDALWFGVHLVGAEAIGAIRNNLDAMLVGKFLGAAALGLYTLAFRIPDLVIRSANMVTGVVLHPIMSSLQHDRDVLRQYYYGCLRYLALFVLPAGAGIAVIADPFVRTLYTDEWLPVVVPMQCLAVALAISTIGFLPGTIYKAINRPDTLSYTAALKLPLMAVTLWFAVPWGINVVAASQIGLAVSYLLIDLLVLNHMIRISFGQIVRAMVPGLVVCILVVGSTLATAEMVENQPLLELVVVTLCGAFVYVVALRFVSAELFVELKRALAERKNVAAPSA
ncbi:MAG: lipopolysaccharide biosynthesis protein [Geminicoccaceae bacterium]